MTKNKINFFNTVTQDMQEGWIGYEFASDATIIEVDFNDIVVKVKNKNSFDALGEIRKAISPWEPMVMGTQKYIFPVKGGWHKVMPNIKFRKRINIKERTLITHPTSETNFAPLEVQKAFIYLYQISFFTNINEEYNISDEYIVLEKIPKYLYFPDGKILNPKPYRYFYIYDEKNNKVYDISNEKEVAEFNAGKLAYEWESLDDFLEYYALNEISICPVPASSSPNQG